MEASFLWFVLNGVYFQARTNPPFNRACNREGVARFKKQTEIFHTKIAAKVQPHHISVLIVYPTQT